MEEKKYYSSGEFKEQKSYNREESEEHDFGRERDAILEDKKSSGSITTSVKLTRSAPSYSSMGNETAFSLVDIPISTPRSKKLSRFFEVVLGILVPPWSLIRALMSRHKLDTPMQLAAGVGSVIVPVAAFLGLYLSGFLMVFSTLSLGWEAAVWYGLIVGCSMLGRGLGSLGYYIYHAYDHLSRAIYFIAEAIKVSLIFAIFGRSGKEHFYAPFTHHLPYAEETNQLLMQLDQLGFFLSEEETRAFLYRSIMSIDGSQIKTITDELAVLSNCPNFVQFINAINDPQSRANCFKLTWLEISNYTRHQGRGLATLITALLDNYPGFFTADDFPDQIKNIAGSTTIDWSGRESYQPRCQQIYWVAKILPLLKETKLISKITLHAVMRSFSSSAVARNIINSLNIAKNRGLLTPETDNPHSHPSAIFNAILATAQHSCYVLHAIDVLPFLTEIPPGQARIEKSVFDSRLSAICNKSAYVKDLIELMLELKTINPRSFTVEIFDYFLKYAADAGYGLGEETINLSLLRTTIKENRNLFRADRGDAEMNFNALVRTKKDFDPMVAYLMTELDNVNLLYKNRELIGDPGSPLYASWNTLNSFYQAIQQLKHEGLWQPSNAAYNLKALIKIIENVDTALPIYKAMMEAKPDKSAQEVFDQLVEKIQKRSRADVVDMNDIIDYLKIKMSSLCTLDTLLQIITLEHPKIFNEVLHGLSKGFLNSPDNWKLLFEQQGHIAEIAKGLANLRGDLKQGTYDKLPDIEKAEQAIIQAGKNARKVAHMNHEAFHRAIKHLSPTDLDYTAKACLLFKAGLNAIKVAVDIFSELNSLALGEADYQRILNQSWVLSEDKTSFSIADNMVNLIGEMKMAGLLSSEHGKNNFDLAMQSFKHVYFLSPLVKQLRSKEFIITQEIFEKIMTVKNEAHSQGILNACEQLQKVGLMADEATKKENLNWLCGFSEFAQSIADEITLVAKTKRNKKLCQKDFQVILDKRRRETLIKEIYSTVGQDWAYDENGAMQLMFTFMDGTKPIIDGGDDRRLYENEGDGRVRPTPTSELLMNVTQHSSGSPLHQGSRPATDEAKSALPQLIGVAPALSGPS